jgi:ribonuclease HII
LRPTFDRKRWKQSKYLCGIDEAGVGPLAGPVVAAAVVLPRDCSLPGVNDSKLIAPKQRAVLYGRILDKCLAWGVGIVNSRRIDEVNIRNADFEAMKKAYARLGLVPDYTIVDGWRIPGFDISQEGIVKGDRKSLSIAAASIIAKVTRDAIMARMHVRYPGYGFDRNKGYPTPEHFAALDRLGVTPIHRRSFEPVRLAMTNDECRMTNSSGAGNRNSSFANRNS